MTIQNATWSQVYTAKSATSQDACHKCRTRIEGGEQYRFIGGWNTARVLCARCGNIPQCQNCAA